LNTDTLKVTSNEELPSGWKYDSIRTILKVKHGRNQAKVQVENGLYPILGSGGKIGEAKEYLWSRPSVLIGRKGTINKPQYYETPFWTVDTLFYTHIKDNHIPKWVFYLFQAINWLKYNEASGVPSLSASNIEAVKVKIPPIQEQKRIADILSIWDLTIELKESIIKDKERYLQSIIQRFKRGLIQKNSLDNWKSTKLKEVFKIRNVKNFESDDLKLYSFTIEDGVSPKTERYNREFLVKGDKKYKLTKYNDLVFNPANLKYGAISVNKNHNDVLISPIYETLYIKDENKYDIDFFKYFLTTSEMISFYKSKVEGTLVERSAVKADQFLLFSIKVPDLETQKKVSKYLNLIELEITTIKKELELLKTQKKGLMQQLLTGKIRVQS